MSDFAVLIAIIAMVLLDVLLGIPTPKLIVPTELKVRAFWPAYQTFIISVYA